MLRPALTAVLLLLAAGVQAQGFPQGLPTPSRLPPRVPPGLPGPATPAPAPAAPRVPIDLGPDATNGEPPHSIDILAAQPATEAPTPSVVKECENEQEAGVVAGEIVVCANLDQDTSQLYSGSREAWLKAYAERTQNAGTIPPPDVAGAGIFRGPATVSGMCFVGPCPKAAALIIDLKAIPAAPAGSDADRVGNGLAPHESETAPVSDEARQRIEAELGLPEAPAEPPKPSGKN